MPVSFPFNPFRFECSYCDCTFSVPRIFRKVIISFQSRVVVFWKLIFQMKWLQNHISESDSESTVYLQRISVLPASVLMLVWKDNSIKLSLQFTTMLCGIFESIHYLLPWFYLSFSLFLCAMQTVWTDLLMNVVWHTYTNTHSKDLSHQSHDEKLS